MLGNGFRHSDHSPISAIHKSSVLSTPALLRAFRVWGTALEHLTFLCLAKQSIKSSVACEGLSVSPHLGVSEHPFWWINPGNSLQDKIFYTCNSQLLLSSKEFFSLLGLSSSMSSVTRGQTSSVLFLLAACCDVRTSCKIMCFICFLYFNHIFLKCFQM